MKIYQSMTTRSDVNDAVKIDSYLVNKVPRFDLSFWSTNATDCHTVISINEEEARYIVKTLQERINNPEGLDDEIPF